MFKIGGFYKISKNEWCYIHRKKQDGYHVIFVDIDITDDGRVFYSEDIEYISSDELENIIKDKTCYSAFKSAKYNCFYAVWDGANKETFRYILPKSTIEDLGLKKRNYPENYYGA